ncbi:sugar porter family MFS transporter [Maricaulis sp.]|uniref:sugar porter family MFS transporter n=1 Tax=Maricaulis sp. TaxID=1486257 RepID=UPI00262F4C5B|nr:sugar porter family MFS transporter [Maricaulis sp.]MDF1768685.1 sugar porter family MFS transporter [Maricaulis sp.]
MTETADSAESASVPAEAPNMGYILAIAIVATIGGFLFGYDSGVINGTVDGLQTAFNSEAIGTGWNVASMLLGCAVGALIAGRAADIFGRRTLLVVAAVFFIISAFGSGIAGGSTEFVVYRLLGGLAVGAASVMAPAYIAEIAPASIRGRLATIQQIAIIAGLFFSFLSNYLLAQTAGGSTVVFWLGFETWRWMFWMELVPAIIFLIALFSIPESPRFLVFKKKTERATSVLSKLFGPVTAKRKVGEIQASLVDDHQPSLRDLISPITKKIRPIVWVGIGLASFQQLVGINIIFYYGAVLWQAAGFTESDALLTNVLSGALSIGSVIVALLVIDKLGRKPMLVIGSIGMAITLGLCAFAFSTGELIDGSLSLSDNMALLALVAANIYVMFFNFSWGPVMWVMLGEMFPNQIRGSGLAVAGLFQWGTNFLISITFLSLLGTIGLAGAYGIYTVFAVLSIWFVIKMVRETRGKELEDMEG